MNHLPNYIPCPHSLDIVFHLRESVSSCYQPHIREWSEESSHGTMWNERRLAMTKIHLDTDIGGMDWWDERYPGHRFHYPMSRTAVPTGCATSLLCEGERAQDASFMALTLADIAEPRPRAVFMTLFMTLS